MLQTTQTEVARTTAHQQFERVLPKMNATFLYAFRHRPFQDRMEAVAEAQACAWKAWVGLLRHGKDPLAVGVSGIARFALKHTLNGRKIGNPNCGRGAMDVFHPRAQRAMGFRVIRDADVQQSGDSEPAHWMDWFAASNRYSPADEACFRLDFRAWLDGLPARKRQMAELLAEGHETSAVARILNVSPAAVSQTRPWLANSWRQYQGEAPGVPG